MHLVEKLLKLLHLLISITNKKEDENYRNMNQVISKIHISLNNQPLGSVFCPYLVEGNSGSTLDVRVSVYTEITEVQIITVHCCIKFSVICISINTSSVLTLSDNIMKSRGPRIEPCGTLHLMFTLSGTLFSSTGQTLTISP